MQLVIKHKVMGSPVLSYLSIQNLLTAPFYFKIISVFPSLSLLIKILTPRGASL